jgi:uncharacterized membrane protein YhaH (DUF805 family)
MDWYLGVLKKYAEFNGRARRKEYWIYMLINLIIAFVVGFVSGFFLNSSVLGVIYGLAVLVPSIAVGVRRMHDTDHSGWWLLFPVVNLILAVQEGQAAANRFGSDPKAGGR